MWIRFKGAINLNFTTVSALTSQSWAKFDKCVYIRSLPSPMCIRLLFPLQCLSLFPNDVSFLILPNTKCLKREIPRLGNPGNFMWIYDVWNTCWRSAYFFFLSFGIQDVLFSSFNLKEYISNFITESARLFWAFLTWNCWLLSIAACSKANNIALSCSPTILLYLRAFWPSLRSL